MQSQAIVPMFLSEGSHTKFKEALVVLGGAVFLSICAQISIALPWTPVPITGQTFAVTLMALAWGSRRGSLVILIYLTAGGLGLPVFAMGTSGFLIGPTFGYLIGMMISTLVVGKLADMGASKTFVRSLATAYLGSVIVFGFGLLGLSLFVDSQYLLATGLVPFLPGDLIKNVLAATLASKGDRLIN